MDDDEGEVLALFQRWFARPFKVLEEKLDHGDGGFIVLATSCFLYERYAKAILKEHGAMGNTDGIYARLQDDFDVDADTAKLFWEIIRNGFLHFGMPKLFEGGKPIADGWQTSNYDVPMEIDRSSGVVLKVNPWRFGSRVVELVEARPDTLEINGSFPWASIWGENLREGA
jgi:hypothetical protein